MKEQYQLATCTSELHLQSLLQKSSKTFAWADHAHGCAEAARSTGLTHIRDWWAGVLANCGDRIETEQFVSEYEPELRSRADVRAIPDVRGHPTYDDTVVSSPGQAESEHTSQPHEDSAVKAAETNKMHDHKLPPNTQAVLPMSIDLTSTEDGAKEWSSH